MNLLDAFEEYRSEMIALRGRRESTLIRYEYCIKNFYRWMNEAVVSDLTPVNIAKFVEHMQEQGNSESTIQLTLDVLSAFTEWAETRKYLDENPFKGFVRKRAEPKPPKALRWSEATSLLDDATGGRMSLRDRTLLSFLLLTFCRPSEATGLTMDRLNMEEGYALLTQTKGRRPRKAMMGPKLKWEMEQYLDWRQKHHPESLFVFVSRHGNRLTPEYVREIPRRYGYNITIYQLRHTGITYALKATKNLGVVQALAGHTDPKTTMKYLTIWDEDRAAVANALDAYDEEQKVNKRGKRMTVQHTDQQEKNRE